MSHTIVTGAKGGATQGAVAPNRLEIHDLIKNKEQFSLYIQALRIMFSTPQNNPLSHFGIGGIHGMPFVSWEGAGGNRPVQGSGWGGYCTHGNVLFPTWHRPYVALYEQALQQHALDVAKTYRTNQQHWISVAQNLRAPYWDWATNSVPPPEVISLQNVNIITPDGKTSSVPNPLYQYTFNPVDPSFPSPWKTYKTTIRDPARNAPSVTDVQHLTGDLKAIQRDLTSSTYNLLSRVRTWPAFSNHSVGDGGSSSNSLEAIHDEIHGTIGGHMGRPEFAAFDPIFFLHHCNVDRMLSLWSAVHSGVWVSQGSGLDGGSWTIAANSPIDSKTNLTPFWISQTGFWASSGTVQTSDLHYTYPEFNGLDLGNKQAVATAISNYINRQYGGGRILSPGGHPGVSLFAQPPAAEGAQAVATPIVSPSRDAPPTHGAPNVIYDWAARIHAKKFELGHGYAVLIFLGEVPGDEEQWRTCPSFVGVHCAFVNSHTDQCSNCREQEELVVEGFVHLNEAIAKHSDFSSYEPSVIAPYLKNNLHWRVESVDRTPVPIEKLASLEVVAVSNILTQEPNADFPTVGEPEHHHEVTRGRAGGSRQAQVRNV
ncbi:photo-regulated tyrosinase [Russula emetica]|nr:photo-regulated tyrosinase [Russula emetica]